MDEEAEAYLGRKDEGLVVYGGQDHAEHGDHGEREVDDAVGFLSEGV
jgi:hypothetical protein